MLVTVHKPCHMPHVSRITTWGSIFTKITFWCVQRMGWGNHKMLGKTSVSKKEREKKNWIAIVKLSALNANAKRKKNYLPDQLHQLNFTHLSVRIQSDCGKMRTRKNSVFGHFSRSDHFFIVIKHCWASSLSYTLLKVGRILISLLIT